MDEGVEDEDSGEEGGGAPEDQAQADAPPAAATPSTPANPAPALPEPGLLTTAWSFISTFFTSLIPEGRPQPGNQADLLPLGISLLPAGVTLQQFFHFTYLPCTNPENHFVEKWLDTVLMPGDTTQASRLKTVYAAKQLTEAGSV